MGMNDNVELGYAMDPTAVYGPSSGSHLIGDREETETRIITDGPVDGPVGPGTSVEGAPTSRITPKGFFSSPAGMLLILLPATYIVFHKAFGNG